MNDTITAKVEPRKWFYVMSGYGGSTSTYIAPYEKTGYKDGGYLCLTDMMSGKPAKEKPMVDSWRCISIDGREFTTSDNEIGAAGIGGIKATPDFCPDLSKPVAEKLVANGFTKDEVAAEFGAYSFLTYDEREADEEWKNRKPKDLTDGMLKMLLALKKINEDEEKAEKAKAAAEFAKARAEMRKRYFYLPFKITEDKKYLRTGEVSRNLREILKREFPKTKFSVRSDSFSGGDSVRVRYEDGPAYEKVAAIVNMFQEKHSDFTGDYWDYDPNAFNCEFGGFSYAHCERNVSEEIIKTIGDILAAKGSRDDRANGYDSDLLRTAKRIADRTDFSGAEIADVVWVDEKDGEPFNNFEVIFKEAPKAAATETTNEGGGLLINGKGGITITENTAKDGIEIRFPSIPSEAVRTALKEEGYRWSRFAKCWWARNTPHTMEAAKRIAGAA